MTGALRAAHGAGQLAAGLIKAEQRRVRRLFATLEDVSYYTSGHASSWMLGQCWDRIADLLLQTGDRTLVAAVRAVAEHDVGSSGWWHAVGQAATATDAHFLEAAGIST